MLPRMASRIWSVSWVINWLARIRLKRYLRASDRMVAKLSVAKFWNSSTYKLKSWRSDSGMSARPMAAALNFITKIIPRSCELSSPTLPFERLTSKIFLLSMISRRSKPLLVWPMMLRIMSFAKKAPNLDANQPSISPLALSVVWAISLFQKSSVVC